MIFEKLADFIVKHAKLVLVVWIIVLLASVYPAMNSASMLSYDTGSMGGTDTESMKGMEIGSDHFLSMVDQENVQMLLVTYDKGDAAKTAAATASANYVKDKLLSDYGKVATVIDNSTDPGLRSLVIVYKSEYKSDEIADDTGNLRSFISNQMEASGQDLGGISTYVTGTPAISYDASTAMASDMALVDPISIFLILILVGLFFRSFVSSAAPPITIGVAFALVMCALFFIGQVLDIYYIVEMLLLVSMLGAGCDYCIFILSRYREERRSGLEHIPACRQAIMWAGESVFTSGLAVMIGFGSMMICDFNMISTMGLGLAIGIVFALLAALTLMSSLVVILGDRLFWPSGASGEKLEKGYLKKFGQLAHSYFVKSTNFSIRHAKVVILATLLFTAPMVYVYATSNTSYDMIGSMMTGESLDGMQVMTDYGDAGSSMPNYVIIETSQPMANIIYLGGAENGIGMLTFADEAYLASVTAANAELDGKVHAIDNGSNIGSTSYVNFNGRWAYLTYQMIGMPLDDALTAMKASVPSMAVLVDNVMGMLNAERKAQIHDAVLAATGDDMSWTVGDPYVAKIMDWIIFVKAGQLGTTVSDDGNAAVCNYYKFTMSTKDQAMSDKSIGTVSEFSDVVHEYAGSSQVLKAAWVTGTAAVMLEISEEMTSQFLRIEITAVVLIIILLFFVMKSYLTPIRSVVTILMSVVWTVAITQLLFTDVLGAGVIWMLPIMLLVICLGLGMDYDILLTTRIREYRFAKGMSNDEAISQAVLHSGSVITICGFIMAGTFGTMMLSSTVMLQQMGFALAFAILVDALVVRTYIVPAAMHLMGDWNWKGPAALSRPVRIGRGFSGIQGILAAVIILVFAAAAFAAAGASFDTVTMEMLLDYSRDSKAYTQLAFGLGGALMLLFGATAAYSGSCILSRASGILYAVSAVIMMVAAFGTVNGSINDLWIAGGCIGMAATALYACFLARNGHALGAGMIAVAAVPLAASVLGGAVTASFGLAIAVAASVLVAGLCECAKVR